MSRPVSFVLLDRDTRSASRARLDPEPETSRELLSPVGTTRATKVEMLCWIAGLSLSVAGGIALAVTR